MPSTEEVEIAWVQCCAVVPVGGREGRTKRRRGGIATSRVDARSPRMPGACWGRAEQGWTSGGALQDGQGRVGWWGGPWQSRHCIEDESSNNRSRIVGQAWPIPTLHPSSPPQVHLRCPQPSPTIVPVVPTAWIVYCFRISHPFARPSSDSLGLVRVTASFASVGARPSSKLVRPPDFSGTEFTQATKIPASAGRHSAGTRSLLQPSQSLGYHCCTSCRSWAPSSRYAGCAAALSAVGHARHLPASKTMQQCRHLHLSRA